MRPGSVMAIPAIRCRSPDPSLNSSVIFVYTIGKVGRDLALVPSLTRTDARRSRVRSARSTADVNASASTGVNMWWWAADERAIVPWPSSWVARMRTASGRYSLAVTSTFIVSTVGRTADAMTASNGLPDSALSVFATRSVRKTFQPSGVR